MDVCEIPQEKYELVVWSEYEEIFKYRHRSEKLQDVLVPFSLSLYVKLRRSVFGTYLKSYNQRQDQNFYLNDNKFNIMATILEEHQPNQKISFEYNNNYLVDDETVDYLDTSLKKVEEFNHEYLYDKLTGLRLDDYYIDFVDAELRHFKNLQVLVLAGNWLKDLSGEMLPRRLTFLELYANFIGSVINLVKKLPKRLLHLGLARNKLNKESKLHLLAASRRLKQLKSLDLADCDLYNLLETLKSIDQLQTVESLQLKGNPCSVVTGYKDAVLFHFPNLIFLDGVEISRSDRKIREDFMEDVNDAEFFFSGFNITGLPKIPKEKKVKQTIHLELWLPLFKDVILTEADIEEEEEEHGKGKKKKKKGGKGKGKKNSKGTKSKSKSSKGSKKAKKKGKKSKSSSKKSKSSKKSSKKSDKKGNPYKRPDEYDPKSWLPPQKKSKKGKAKKKKGKKKKGDKSSKKSDKSSKKSKSSKSSKKKGSKKGDKKGKGKKGKKKDKSTISEDTEKIEKKVKEPKEKILKRVTLASFDCDLRNCLWNDKDLDYLWADDDNYFQDKAIEYKVHLDNLQREKERMLEEKAALKRKQKEEAAARKAAKKAKKGKKGKGKKGSKKSDKSSSKSGKSSKKSGKGSKKSSKGSKKSSKGSKKSGKGSKKSGKGSKKSGKGSKKSGKGSKKSKKSKRSKTSSKKGKSKGVSCRVSFGLTRK